MDYDDETSNISLETGSDELLSDDNLRLPESANILVRTHAVRAWLAHRQEERTLEVGEAALALQQIMMQEPSATRLRRRERETLQLQIDKQQQKLTDAQQRLEGYLEAQTLLEDCITHTSGDRVLVEYYLALEDLVHNIIHDSEDLVHNVIRDSNATPRLQALFDVQHRVEHVGAPNEED